MRRIAAVVAVAASFIPAASAQAANTRANWDRAEQKAVQRAGIMPALAGGFRGGDPLTANQFNAALVALAKRSSGSAKPAAVAPTARVTVALFHKALVKQLGLA